jgi:hypothetical protein
MPKTNPLNLVSVQCRNAPRVLEWPGYELIAAGSELARGGHITTPKLRISAASIATGGWFANGAKRPLASKAAGVMVCQFKSLKMRAKRIPIALTNKLLNLCDQFARRARGSRVICPASAPMPATDVLVCA